MPQKGTPRAGPFGLLFVRTPADGSGEGWPDAVDAVAGHGWTPEHFRGWLTDLWQRNLLRP